MSVEDEMFEVPRSRLRELADIIADKSTYIAELETELENAQTTLEADLEYQHKIEAELAEALAERDAYSNQTDEQDLDIKFLSGRNTDLKDDLAEANKVIDTIETLLLYPDRVPTPLSNRLTVVLAEYRKKAGS